MSATGPSNDGSNDTKVSGYEREINKQKEKARQQANVEMGLGKSSKNATDGTLSDPREKDDTAAKKDIKNSRRTTTNYGGGDGGNNNGNQVVQAPQVVEELPQQVKATEATMTADEARDKANALIKKRRIGRGRSQTILTSAQGITNEPLTLGTKTLLG